MLAVAQGYRPQPTAPTLEPVGGDADGTTYLATVDAQGNMVSATPSTFEGLSQGMILGDTGILINCRGCYFWLDPDHPNVLAPRKRPRTTPCTFIVLRQGQPYMTLGTPGGDSQPQSGLQVFTNMIDFGLDVQEAVEAPRFWGWSFPQSPWPHRSYANSLQVEARLSRDVVATLDARGHQVEVVGPWGVTNGSALIDVNPDVGVYQGGADPRLESVMLGWSRVYQCPPRSRASRGATAQGPAEKRGAGADAPLGSRPSRLATSHSIPPATFAREC